MMKNTLIILNYNKNDKKKMENDKNKFSDEKQCSPSE